MSATAAAKYLHMSMNNVAAKWKAIKLSEVSKDLTVTEAKSLLDQLWQHHTREQNKYIKRLKELSAPDCLLKHSAKVAASLARKVHPDLAPLKRVIK